MRLPCPFSGCTGDLQRSEANFRCPTCGRGYTPHQLLVLSRRGEPVDEDIGAFLEPAGPPTEEVPLNDDELLLDLETMEEEPDLLEPDPPTGELELEEEEDDLEVEEEDLDD